MIPALALLALGTLLGADAAAQSRSTDYFHCVCPGNRHVKVYDSENKTCEEACGVSSGPGSSGPDWNAIRAQQQAEQAAREAREREAAAAAERRARAIMERQKFETDKREALQLLKGVSVGEGRLKGVDAPDPHGLKGVDSGGLELKGLEPQSRKAAREDVPADGDAGPAKKCSVVDDCSDALESQTRALDSARREQADLYMAMGTADLRHGLDLAQSGLKERLKSLGAPVAKIKVWKDDDQAGLAMYQRDYKTTVDDIFQLAGRKRAAALSGKLDPRRSSLARSEGGKLAAEGLHEQWKDKSEKAKKLLGFSKYVRELARCGEVPPSEYSGCVAKAGTLYGAVLELLPVADATQARVKAIGDAYTRYATRALERAMDVTRAAAKCFRGCTTARRARLPHRQVCCLTPSSSWEANT